MQGLITVESFTLVGIGIEITHESYLTLSGSLWKILVRCERKLDIFCESSAGYLLADDSQNISSFL